MKIKFPGLLWCIVISNEYKYIKERLIECSVITVLKSMKKAKLLKLYKT